MMPQPRPYPASVLIVEDDSDVALSISEVVSSLGYRTIMARNGREAMTALDDDVVPSVMLIDMLMPHMSGSEFLGLVRRSSKWSRIPRVIITGTNDPMISIREDAPVLFKPVDYVSLAQVVQAYCEHGQQM